MLPDGAVIVAINPGHDGTFVVVKNNLMVSAIPAEHNSKPRYSPANAYFLLRNIMMLDEVPFVIATSGWSNGWPFQSASTPYHGIKGSLTHSEKVHILGHAVHLYESTHERSHIFCAYGMAPFPQGEPCYVLVWEGDIGSFYEVDDKLNIKRYGPVLSYPGYKYSFLYDLADPSSVKGTWRHDVAGKLMALAGFSTRTEATEDEQRVSRRVLETVAPPFTDKKAFADTAYLNCGVTEPNFRELVTVFSNMMFDLFFSYARVHLRKRYPLLIAGGCGLNCDWNTRWRDCGLFRDVFVPPVPNDSGSAIGTAIEAQFVFSGVAKIEWNVYSGPAFLMDGGTGCFEESTLDYNEIADMLTQGRVIAWVHDRAEIGPRALGHRSLLAAPFKTEMKDRLNKIKEREWYRPIAPVCLEEDSLRLFGLHRRSPFMLFFQPVYVSGLDAITHVDGSARVQTVNESENQQLYQLLKAFRLRTGFGVLCNTSLNRKGRGFFGRSSDLFDFAAEKGIDAVVINSHAYFPSSHREI
jgi:predicted NodU family carbamoyl transferase